MSERSQIRISTRRTNKVVFEGEVAAYKLGQHKGRAHWMVAFTQRRHQFFPRSHYDLECLSPAKR